MFRFSEEQIAFRESVRALCDDKVAPNAAAADAEATFPQASWKAVCDAGYAGLTLPEEWGGSGADLLTWALCIEEVARACPATAVTLLVHSGCAGLVNAFGTDVQKADVLPGAAAGERVLGFAQSEPEAGSDVAGISTRAAADGSGGWVLDGRKQWISSAGVATDYVVFAKTTPEAGAKGITMFLVGADADGFSVGRLENKMGLRGSPTGDLLFEGVQVGPDAVIGALDRGFSLSMDFLQRSRPMVGAQAVGVAQAALDVAAAYVKERTAFGRRVYDFQGVQFMLADMRIGIETARAQIWRAVSAVAAGDPDATVQASIAKCHATDVGMRVCTDAVQLLGGSGYVKDFPVERHMRDAKVFQIYEGTNQIQRWIIARNM